MTAPYLVAADGALRTYIDYGVTTPGDRVPRLAQWAGDTVGAPRSMPFVPGQVLTPAQMTALLPALAIAPITIDISQPPYSATQLGDAAPAIQSALNDASFKASCGHPVDVLVPPGNYHYAAVLYVPANVRLRGVGGVLIPTNQAASAINLAVCSGALFLTIQGAATSRLTTPDACGIWIGPRTSAGPAVHSSVVVGNDVSGTACAGIFALASIDGIVAFNNSHDGWSDAIHHSGASAWCQVVGNRSSGSLSRGDDLFAFVGYAADGDPVHHCSCIANAGHYGNARGVSLVGAGFVDAEFNEIVATNWAGIYIAQEDSYSTYGSFGHVVADNDVSYANIAGSHGGLLAYSDSPTGTNSSKTFGTVAHQVQNLTIAHNSFPHTQPGISNGQGLKVRGSCAGGSVTDNIGSCVPNPGFSVDGTGFTVTGNQFVGPT